jgi:hypothetical protein
VRARRAAAPLSAKHAAALAGLAVFAVAIGARAGAPPVPADGVLAAERFWPYQVSLVAPVASTSGTPVAPGTTGVLIRVENDGRARIDFGRDGLAEAPVAATDLVERANAIRTGDAEKMAPNFVFAIAPRVADPASDTLAVLPFEAALANDRFLCVFADPGDARFAALAKDLGTLRLRPGLLTILFAQGEHADRALRARLREMSWPVPFVYDHLAEAYTRSLLDAATPRPAVQLVTREGRVLFEAAWQPGVAREVERAVAAR